MISRHNIVFIVRAFLEMKRKRYGISYRYIFNTCPTPESPREAYYESYMCLLEEAIYEHNKIVRSNQHEKCFIHEINTECPLPNEIIKVSANSDLERFYHLEDLNGL